MYIILLLLLLNSIVKYDATLSLLQYKDTLYCVLSNANTAISLDDQHERISYDYYNITRSGGLQGQHWHLKNSLERGFEFAPILDYRWESFPLQRQCRYELPETGRFESSFSIQGTDSVYLCQSISGGCFTILFGSNGPFRSPCTLRGFCANHKALSGGWLHFTLTLYEQGVTIKQHGIGRQIKISTTFRPKLLALDGQCKPHSFNMYVSDCPSEVKLQLENDFSKTDDICLGLFFKTALTASNTLTLTLRNSDSKQVATTSSKSEGDWKEVKICGKIERNTLMTLEIIPLTSHRYYFADMIRTFTNYDVRVATSKSEDSHCCYNVASSEKICFTHLERYNPPAKDAHCPSTTIGANCIPCESIFNTLYCKQVSICETTSSDVACSCSSGYRNTNCTEKCPEGYYGFNCTKECHGCMECHHITGLCKSIPIPSVNLIAASKLHVQVTPKYATVLENQRAYFQCQMTNTTLLYCRVVIPGIGAVNLNSEIETSKGISYIGDGLKAGDCGFSIDKVTAKNNGEISCHLGLATNSEEFVGTMNLTVTNDHSSGSNASEILIKMNGSTLEVHFPRYARLRQFQVHCMSAWCLTEKYIVIATEDTMYFTVRGYTVYTLKIVKDDDKLPEKVFLTNPTEPNPVRNFTAYSTGIDSVAMRWLEPYPPTGKLHSYILTVMVQNTQGSSVRIYTKDYCKIWTNYICTTVRDLSPNTEYVFSVTAMNHNVLKQGPRNSIVVATTNKDLGTPENVVYKWNEMTNALILTWNHPDVPNDHIKQFLVHISNVFLAYEVIEERIEYTYEVEWEKLNVGPSTDVLLKLYSYSESSGRYSIHYPLNISTPPKTPKFLEDPVLVNVAATSVILKLSDALNVDGENRCCCTLSY